MLSNTITLNDGVDDNTYDLVSREGMNSIRRETGVSSTIGSALVIKNTVDLNAPTTKNRHLIQLSQNEIDGTTGEKYPFSVHVVITRDKNVADATIKKLCVELAAFITSSTNMDDVLIGGN
jgi:hypothetical protein